MFVITMQKASKCHSLRAFFCKQHQFVKKPNSRSFSSAEYEDMAVPVDGKFYTEPGMLYKVPLETVKSLNYTKIYPPMFIKQIDTLDECVWLCREHLVEAIDCLQAVGPTLPALRLVLWGSFGTGKTLTLQQLIHHAHTENFVLLSVRSGMSWNRGVLDAEFSTYKEGRINTPGNAVGFLQMFKHQNEHTWSTLSTLTTERAYIWGKHDSTPEGKPITDLIDVGLIGPTFATDVACVLWRELRRYASMGKIKLFVAVDHANSLYGTTSIKRPDKTNAKPEEIVMVRNFKKFFNNDWSNGVCVLVADKAEHSNPEDRLTVPRNTPLELFGEKGLDAIDPFIPIETKLYSKDEYHVIYDYYKEKNWITSEKARSDVGKQQMMYLSAYNPYYFERMCAFL